MSVAGVSAAHAAADTRLSALTISTGSFDSPFDPDASSVAITVPHTTTSFSFTPTAFDAGATITTWTSLGGTAVVASGAPSPSTGLLSGLNIMTATVSLAGEPDRQYTLMVTKLAPPPPAHDTRLASLSVADGALSPAFDSDTTSYSLALPYATTSIVISGTPMESGNTVTVKNLTTNQTGSPVTVLAGGVAVFVTVTAPDATSRDYVIMVTRAPAPTADVDLASLGLSSGTLSPAFDPSVTSYTATVPYAVRTVQLTATAHASGNTMTLNNDPLADGVASTVPLILGSNGFAVLVRAANGVERLYVVNVTREQPSNDADLTGLSLSAGTISPTFSNAATAYTATVPYLTTSTTVTATLADPTAILRVNGHDTPSGAASDPVPLVVGPNSIVVEATAEDGVTTTSRTIVVTREAPDLDLAALTVSGGTLSPAFDPAVTSYTLVVPYPTTAVDVAAAAVESAWTLRIGTVVAATRTVPISVGSNAITVRVTALHGEFRDYTVTVDRTAPSADAALGGLTLSQGTLSPAFDPAVTGYTATVGYLVDELEVGASLADGTATMTIDGDPVDHATVPLAVGANTVVVVTTAEDGVTTITTTIVITRAAAAPTAELDLGFAAGDPADGAPFDLVATHLLPGSAYTVTAYSSPVVLLTGTVGAGGSVSWAGHLPAALGAGEHRLVFEGIGEDGRSMTVTAWFTVLRNGTIGAVSLAGPVAYREPASLAATGAPGAADAASAGLLLALLGAVLVVRTARRRLA